MQWRIPPLPSALLPVLAGVASTQMALGVMSTLVPLLLVARGVPAASIGLVGSAYYVGFLGGALTAERIVARAGHVRAFAVFAALAADGALLMALATDPWAYALLRAVIGYATSGVFLVAESWLNAGATPATRGRRFAAYLVVSWGGSALGPILMQAAAPRPLAFVLVGMAFATALVPMALNRQADPAIGASHRVDLFGLYRTSPAGVVLCLAAGLVNSAFYGLAPVYLAGYGTDAGVGTGGIALFMSASMVAGLLMQFPVGLLSDRLGRRRVALGCLLTATAMAVVLATPLAGAYALRLAAGCVMAGMTAPLYGLGSGQTNDRLRDGNYVGAAGGLLFAWSVGSTVGPTLSGGLMGTLGPSALFGYLAFVLGAVALFTGLRMVQRSGVPRDSRTPFVPANAAPPSLAALSAAAPPEDR